VAQTCGELERVDAAGLPRLEFDRSIYHYKSRRREQAGIEDPIREICATRVRYGYWRVHVLLKREGWDVSAKRTYGIDRHLGLQLRSKSQKRRMNAKLRDDRQEAGARMTSGPWISFRIKLAWQEDPCAGGYRHVHSDHVRARSRFGYRAERRGAGHRSRCALRSLSEDDPRRPGSEFVSRDLDLWAYARA
jgi:putative transposase